MSHRTTRAALSALVAFVALASVPGPLGAQRTPLGQDGDPIGTSAYGIDLFQGPVFAGTRVTGLAGAYVAVAEDVDGDLQNPATPANRPFYSKHHFDYWLGLGLTFPAGLSNLDFFNSGKTTRLSNLFTEFVFFTPAANIQWGPLGLGVTASLQNYELAGTSGNNEDSLATLLATIHTQAAYSVLDGQLTFGYGLRLLTMSILQGGSNATGTPIFRSRGAGAEIGVLIRPNEEPFRIGASVRSRIETSVHASSDVEPDAAGDFVVGHPPANPVYLPITATLPWDFNLGVAYQFGRPLNPRWVNPQDADAFALYQQRLRHMQRPYLLVSAELVITGPVREAVGVESFLSQTVQRSGAETVLSPRLGMEAEVVPNRLTLRLGSYYEPTRFANSHPRVHGTLGGDVRLFNWSVFGLWPDDYLWKLGAAIDVSARYFTWAISIGGWH